MVFWHQDIYSEAIGNAARRAPARSWVGSSPAWPTGSSAPIARRSMAIVAISPTFLERLSEWGVADRTVGRPELGPHRRAPGPRRATTSGADAWASAGIPIVLYSGTLGLKHDPSILALIAAQLRVSHPDAKVVVVSEGKGRDWLETWKREQLADNLVLLDFQPYEDLPRRDGERGHPRRHPRA